MKKIIAFLFVVLVFLGAYPVFAQQRDKVNIYFFYGDGCPHCANEEIFLAGLEERSNVEILRYEVWYNQENAKLLSRVGKELNVKASGIPFTIIGTKTFVGFYDAQTTGRQVEAAVQDCQINECEDVIAPLLNPDKEPKSEEAETAELGENEIDLPILGTINTQKYSLPVLTLLIAAVDGFNPCAMWVLLFLISLLLGMEDRKKMWILGSAFIFTSAAVYFLFLSAWLNLFIFLGFIVSVRIAIGLVAVGSGGYHLREWWTNREGVCKVSGGEKRKLIFAKLKAIVQTKKFIFALGGIVFLAAAVNLIELVCSAGLPAVYTQILALAELSTWKYYGYLIFYVFIFMLDDLLVFGIAMLTLQSKVVTAGYSRWSNLIGGVIMIIIGLLLLFKPGWLMFS